MFINKNGENMLKKPVKYYLFADTKIVAKSWKIYHRGNP
jgi:hypothetical protein